MESPMDETKKIIIKGVNPIGKYPKFNLWAPFMFFHHTSFLIITHDFICGLFRVSAAAVTAILSDFLGHHASKSNCVAHTLCYTGSKFSICVPKKNWISEEYFK